jgi:tyrosinase
MNTIVKQFPQEQQEDIQIAVDHWRYPYWDWALADPATHLLDIPELMRLPTIQIQRPDGTTPTIDNPLYRYAFPLNKEQKIDGIDDVVESVDKKDFVVPVRPATRFLA